MIVYLDLMMILNFLVDFLLLVCAERLAGFYPSWGRIALASILGGIYAGIILVPGWIFLGNFLWRMVSYGIMSVIAFGWHKSTLRKAALFLLMTMVLGGAASGIQADSFGAIIGTAMAVTVLCIFSFRGKTETAQYIPVEITHQGKHYRTTALLDTGNTLRDPISGERVLVADALIGQMLFGFTRSQLLHPVETMLSAPTKGLRLIPYCTVGQGNGMLLAVRCQEVRIDNWKGSAFIAFSPERFGKGDVYQVLTGGLA